MELIPAIDVLGGRVVRLLRGDYGAATTYADDPLAVARHWVEEGARRLHLVDLEGAREGRPVQAAVLEAVATAAGVPCQVAGGLRSEAAAGRALDAGADRVVLGSALVSDPGMASRLVARHGPERIVAALDVRGDRALGDGWVPGARDADARSLARSLAGAGVRWFAVTAISRDGSLGGPDLELLRAVAEAVPGARLIASGGVSDAADVQALAAAGLPAVILGRALYEGTLTLEAALRAAGEGARGR